jgi:hypothetical protein
MFSKPAPSVPVAASKPAADPAPWAQLADRLAALEVSVARLGADITALKSAPPPVKESDGAALKAMEYRLGTLAASVKAMEGQLAKAAAPLEGAGTLALMALAGVLRQGTPFAPLAARVRGDLTAKGDGERVAGVLDGLAAYAVKGVPTRPLLAAGLQALPLPAPKIEVPSAKAAPKMEQPAGFWDKVWARVSKSLKFRRVGDKKPPVPNVHALARAATAKALAKDDFSAAAEASKGLTGAAADTWRMDLRARIKADGLAMALDEVIAARLGSKADKP